MLIFMLNCIFDRQLLQTNDYILPTLKISLLTSKL